MNSFAKPLHNQAKWRHKIQENFVINKPKNRYLAIAPADTASQ